MNSANEKNEAVSAVGATDCYEQHRAPGCETSFIERDSPHEDVKPPTQPARGGSVVHHVRTKVRLLKPDLSMFPAALFAGLLAALAILSIVTIAILIVALGNVNSALIANGVIGVNDRTVVGWTATATVIEGTEIVPTTVTAARGIKASQTTARVEVDPTLDPRASVAPRALTDSSYYTLLGGYYNSTAMPPPPSAPGTTGATEAISGSIVSAPTVTPIPFVNRTSTMSIHSTSTVTATSVVDFTVTVPESTGRATGHPSDSANCAPPVTVTLTVEATVYPEASTSAATDAISTTGLTTTVFSTRPTVKSTSTRVTTNSTVTSMALTTGTGISLVTGTGIGTASGSIVTVWTHNTTFTFPKATATPIVVSGADSNTVKTSSKSRSGTAVSYCVIMMLGYYLVGLV